MPFEIVPLEDKHYEDAAALVSARFRALRQHIPLLPSRYENATTILSLLSDFAGEAPGVAAMHHGRLAGFLLGCVIPEFRGKRSAFSPEWANAADMQYSRRIYQEMYAQLSAYWVADECFTHLVSLLAHDHQAIDGWQWLGFGSISVDALRGLQPVQGPTIEVDIRRGSLEDIESAISLSEALKRYMAAAPTFLFHTEERGREYHKKWLGNPANALWLAYHGTEPIADIGLGPANPNACTIINDGQTTSIIRAFTRESERGKGIATALLNRSLEWARSEGYERCAVDFEPMNILATRFWMRHFQPVCYSLVRHIDH